MSSQDSVLVTGASTGIGREIVEFLATKDFHVYAGARKQADIDALSSLQNVQGLKIDVTSDEDVKASLETIESEGRKLFGLVNNAGIAVSGPLIDLQVEDLRNQFEVNVYGAFRMVKTYSHHLLETKGRIVNISSIAGRITLPFLTPYSMSKFALEAFSDGLRRELGLRGVKTISIEPGSVKTPIWDKTNVEDSKFENSIFKKEARQMGRFMVSDGKKNGLEPIKIAKLVHKVLTMPKPKPRYLITRKQFMNKLMLKTTDSMKDSYFMRNFKK